MRPVAWPVGRSFRVRRAVVDGVRPRAADAADAPRCAGASPPDGGQRQRHPRRRRR
eukprot:ctg_6668.g669